MATIGTDNTLMDVARRLDPDGKIAAIVELLNENAEVLQEMQFMEGNLPTGNRTTIRTGLPTPIWRLLNYGVAQSKSVTQQVTDVCGMLEGYSLIDIDLANMSNNKADFRASEDSAFLEAFHQTLANVLFYGDTDITPEKFMGLSPRFDTPSASVNNSGYNLINAGGSGSDNTSIWLVVWGPRTVHGIFPKGSKAGFTHSDDGIQTVLDAAGGRYKVYQSHFKWDIGLTVRDWRYIVRICNIDVSNLTKDAASGADLINLIVQAVELPPDLNGSPAIYCARTIKSFLRRQITNKDNVNLSLDTVAGKKVLTFDGIPVRRTDQISVAEATITGTFGHDDS